MGVPPVVDYYQYVLTNYFETMGIPIVRGRGFQPTDATSSGLVAIVNEKFADTFWKGRDPIGQRARPCCNDQTPWFTVVGVAKDVKQRGVNQETGTELYMSVQQVARPGRGLEIAPLNHVGRMTKPMVIAQGRNDPRVPYTEAEQMAAALKARGTPVWTAMAMDEGHGIAKKPNGDFLFYILVEFARRVLALT